MQMDSVPPPVALLRIHRQSAKTCFSWSEPGILHGMQCAAVQQRILSLTGTCADLHAKDGSAMHVANLLNCLLTTQDT